MSISIFPPSSAPGRPESAFGRPSPPRHRSPDASWHRRGASRKVVGTRLAKGFAMPALTGQCKRCSRYGELFPVRGIYYCRPCGEVFDRHLRGYPGPDRRTQGDAEGPRRRWSDVKAADPFLFLRSG